MKAEEAARTSEPLGRKDDVFMVKEIKQLLSWEMQMFSGTGVHHL